MKRIRTIFFCFFALSALISTHMMYNLLRDGVGYGMWPVVAAALMYIALQLAGCIAVIIGRNRVITGIFTMLTGIATALSGFMTFASLGAPAPQVSGKLSLISMGVSLLLCIGYMVLGVQFFQSADKNTR